MLLLDVLYRQFALSHQRNRLPRGGTEFASMLNSFIRITSSDVGAHYDRLAWFYRRTPLFDDHWLLYPVAREE